MTGPVMAKESRATGLIRVERIQLICPACGQQVEAVARERRVSGYCAVARQSVDFRIENHHPETRADRPTRPGRDSKGHFVKGNVPWNKKR